MSDTALDDDGLLQLLGKIRETKKTNIYDL